MPELIVLREEDSKPKPELPGYYDEKFLQMMRLMQQGQQQVPYQGQPLHLYQPGQVQNAFPQEGTIPSGGLTYTTTGSQQLGGGGNIFGGLMGGLTGFNKF